MLDLGMVLYEPIAAFTTILLIQERTGSVSGVGWPVMGRGVRFGDWKRFGTKGIKAKVGNVGIGVWNGQRV